MKEFERMVGIKLWYLKEIPFPSIFLHACLTFFIINEMVNLKYLSTYKISIVLYVLMVWAKNLDELLPFTHKFWVKTGSSKSVWQLKTN